MSIPFRITTGAGVTEHLDPCSGTSAAAVNERHHDALLITSLGRRMRLCRTHVVVTLDHQVRFFVDRGTDACDNTAVTAPRWVRGTREHQATILLPLLFGDVLARPPETNDEAARAAPVLTSSAESSSGM